MTGLRGSGAWMPQVCAKTWDDMLHLWPVFIPLIPTRSTTEEGRSTKLNICMCSSIFIIFIRTAAITLANGG
jgi:hypothetical protein